MRGWRASSASTSQPRGQLCCRRVPHFGVDEPEPEPEDPEPPLGAEGAELPPEPEPLDPLEPPLSLFAGAAGALEPDEPLLLEDDSDFPSPPLFLGDEE